MKHKPNIPNTYKSLDDLTPYRIGIVHGYVNRPDFDAANYLNKIKFYSDEEAIRQLSEDKCDMIVIDKWVASYLMTKTNIHKKVSFLSPMLDSKMLHLAFSKKIPDKEKKIMAFEYGFLELKKSGKLKQMLKRFNQLK